VDVGLLARTLIQLYGMMALGFVLAKANILDDHVNRKLSAMVVTAVYPMMLLCSMMGQPGDRLEALALLGAGFGIYIAMIFFGKAVSWLLRVPPEKRREFECLMVFGNTGFIGAPLAQSLYGNAAFFQMTLLNFAYYFFYNTYAAGTLAPDSGEKRKFRLKDLLTPGFVMTLLAVVLYLVRFDAPPIVRDTLYMVGSMTTPLSMIILGSSLAMYPFRQSVTDPWSYVYCGAKLLVLPAVTFFLSRLLRVNVYFGDLAVLSNAMPAGSMVLMLALQMKRDSGFISRSIFVSTLLSALSLPVLAVLFLH